MTRPEWIEVGRVSRAHGVRGELRVMPSSDNPDRFVPGAVFLARPERVGLAGPRLQEQVRLTINSVRGDDDFPIVAFEEVADREAAEAVRGYVLEVAGADLPELEDGEYYPFDLIGLQVRDDTGAQWGRVVDVVETPGHALLAVVPSAAEVLNFADTPATGEVPATGAAATEVARPGAAAAAETLIPFVTEAVPTVSVDEGYLVVATRFLEQS